MEAKDKENDFRIFRGKESARHRVKEHFLVALFLIWMAAYGAQRCMTCHGTEGVHPLTTMLKD